jgi:hypothetical protein
VLRAWKVQAQVVRFAERAASMEHLTTSLKAIVANV